MITGIATNRNPNSSPIVITTVASSRLSKPITSPVGGSRSCQHG